MVKQVAGTGEKIAIVDNVELKVIKGDTSFGVTNCCRCDKAIDFKNYNLEEHGKPLCSDCMTAVYELVKGSKA